MSDKTMRRKAFARLTFTPDKVNVIIPSDSARLVTTGFMVYSIFPHNLSLSQFFEIYEFKDL
jgi:hypothetical protein